MLLSQIQVKDNKQGGMQQNLGVREKPTAPTDQTLRRHSQFME
jgi:hypothetical protein